MQCKMIWLYDYGKVYMMTELDKIQPGLCYYLLVAKIHSKILITYVNIVSVYGHNKNFKTFIILCVKITQFLMKTPLQGCI